MIASEIVAQRKQSNVDRHPPLAAIVPMPRPGVRSIERRDGATRSNRASRRDFLSRSTARGEFEQLYRYFALRSDRPTRAGPNWSDGNPWGRQDTVRTYYARNPELGRSDWGDSSSGWRMRIDRNAAHQRRGTFVVVGYPSSRNRTPFLRTDAFAFAHWSRASRISVKRPISRRNPWLLRPRRRLRWV
jgi:hypothetical protein